MKLKSYSTDKNFVNKFIQIKRDNKAKLKKWVKENTGIDIPIDAMYDV